MARKMGRNGKEECDESSEAILINRMVKIAIQLPREDDQTNDRGAAWVTEVRGAKKERVTGKEERQRGIRDEILTCSPN